MMIKTRNNTHSLTFRTALPMHTYLGTPYTATAREPNYRAVPVYVSFNLDVRTPCDVISALCEDY
jgi:hypothetical protein